MKKFFFVYHRNNENFPIITPTKLPSLLMRGKQKYVGKKAKIEAISRLSNIRLLSTLTSHQINEYIADNIFNKPVWREYHSILKSVSQEFEILPDTYELSYALVVELDDFNNFDDYESLIYFLSHELIGIKMPEYKGFKNPIISFTKQDND